MTKPNKPAPPILPAGSVGRWPLEATGYGENVYETSPQRPWVDFADAYGKPVRAKLSCATQDVAISYFPALPVPDDSALKFLSRRKTPTTRKPIITSTITSAASYLICK